MSSPFKGIHAPAVEIFPEKGTGREGKEGKGAKGKVEEDITEQGGKGFVEGKGGKPGDEAELEDGEAGDLLAPSSRTSDGSNAPASLSEHNASVSEDDPPAALSEDDATDGSNDPGIRERRLNDVSEAEQANRSGDRGDGAHELDAQEEPAPPSDGASTDQEETGEAMGTGSAAPGVPPEGRTVLRAGAVSPIAAALPSGWNIIDWDQFVTEEHGGHLDTALMAAAAATAAGMKYSAPASWDGDREQRPREGKG